MVRAQDRSVSTALCQNNVIVLAPTRHHAHFILVLIPSPSRHKDGVLNTIVDSELKMSSNVALQTFSLVNSITEISPQDEIYRFDDAENRRINQEEPWTKE